MVLSTKENVEQLPVCSHHCRGSKTSLELMLSICRFFVLNFVSDINLLARVSVSFSVAVNGHVCHGQMREESVYFSSQFEAQSITMRSLQ